MGIREAYRKSRPITFTTEEALQKVGPIFAQKPEVLLVYLFGSRSREEATPESDLDLAFFTSTNFTWNDYYTLYGEISVVLLRIVFIWCGLTGVTP